MAARTGNWIKRLELVEKAWRVLDKYNDGSVTMEDLMEVYDVSLHPDVFAGKITEEEAILEFAKQWDHDKSGAITQNEFIDYYRGVSNSIKDDEHFEELIKAAWKLPDDDAVDDGLYGVGRSRPVTEPPPKITADEEADNIQLMLRKRLEILTGFADVGTQAYKVKQYFKKYDEDGSGDLQFPEFDKALVEILAIDEESSARMLAGRRALFDRYDRDTTEDLSYEELADGLFRLKPHPLADVESRRLMEKIRNGIVTSEGIYGLRYFGFNLRTMDDQKLGYLPVDELLVCLKDVNVQIADHEKKLLLKFFDLSPAPKGTIDITEFMRGIRGKFLKSRIALLERVWREKIAPTGAQKVPIKEVLRLIDFTHDPDVFTGRLTREQAIRDFPDLWDKNLDGFINWHEFVDFYRDISAALETEAHFEMILRNAWSFNFVETNTIKTIGRRVLVSLKNGHKKYVDFDVPEDEYFNPDDLTFMRKKLFLRGVKDVLMVHDAGLAPEKHKTGATSRGIVAEQALGYGSMRAG